MNDNIQVGRLAMRQEGGNWNAYYTAPGTMEKALFIGSIKMTFIVEHRDRKNAFINLMRDGVADIIEEATGARPEWGGPTPAPEHERAGNA